MENLLKVIFQPPWQVTNPAHRGFQVWEKLVCFCNVWSIRLQVSKFQTFLMKETLYPSSEFDNRVVSLNEWIQWIETTSKICFYLGIAHLATDTFPAIVIENQLSLLPLVRHLMQWTTCNRYLPRFIEFGEFSKNDMFISYILRCYDISAPQL